MVATSSSFTVRVLLLCLLSAYTLVDSRELQHIKLDHDDVKLIKQQLRSAVAEFFAGEFIIEVNNNTTDVRGTVEKMMEGSGGTIKYVYKNLFKGAAVSNMSDFSILKVLDQVSVVRASRNAKVTLNLDQQNAVWGIDRIVPPLDDIYSYAYNGTGVQAYILDTGIQSSHTEFGGRASCGYTAYNNDNCRDVQGHGTHVAGTVGGLTYGVAKNVQLIAVKVLSDNGSGSYSAMYAGLDYVVGQKKANPNVPMVINMSLGGPKSQTLNDNIAKTVDAGITTVVAAGNSNLNACNYSPASAKKAITVGATDEADNLASYSNSGPCVDILAPGTGITSAWVGISSNTNIATISGTSMASPHVAGIAVLHLQKNNALTPSQVVTAMRNDAIKKSIFIRRSWLFPYKSKTPNLLLTGNSLQS